MEGISLDNESSRIITIPNILTFIRLLLIPAFLIAYYQLPNERYISMGIYVLANLTDALDGFLARKLNQVSSFGKLFDPLADKLMVLSMLFCLSYDGYLAQWVWLNKTVLLVMLVKEALMVVGAMFMLNKGTVVYSNYWGKSATALMCVAVVAVFPWHEIGWLRTAGQYLVLASVILALCAFISYLTSSIRLIRSEHK